MTAPKKKWEHLAERPVPADMQPCLQCIHYATHEECRQANLRWKKHELPPREVVRPKLY